MTPNTKLKTHKAPLTRAALPPLLEDSRDWPENGAGAPAAEAAETQAPAGDADAQDLKFSFDVAIVGLGYVGLPTALAINASGRSVLGLDVSENRLAVIRSRQADLLDSDKVRLTSALEDPSFMISTDLSQLAQAAAVVVCVPTPVDPYLVPDLGILRAACASVVEFAVPGQLLMLTSTTYVGSTRDLLAVPLAAKGLIPGRDVFVAFSPERINPGVDAFSHEDVPRVVGGVTPACGEAAEALLRASTKLVHVVPSADVAEMTKLVENTFRAVNIALANEFADICHGLGMEVMDVIDAASTKPYGFMPFTPGPGVGGHCIPCDPHYLLWQLRKARVTAPVIEHAMAGIAGQAPPGGGKGPAHPVGPEPRNLRRPRPGPWCGLQARRRGPARISGTGNHRRDDRRRRGRGVPRSVVPHGSGRPGRCTRVAGGSVGLGCGPGDPAHAARRNGHRLATRCAGRP